MSTGFYFNDTFFEIASRKDLFRDDVQRALESARGHDCLRCGCVEHEGRFPRLISCKWPTRSVPRCTNAKVEGNVNKQGIDRPRYVRSVSAIEHGPLCVLHLWKDLSKVRQALPTSAIFFDTTRHGAWPELDFHTDGGRERSTTFRAFVGEQVANAWIRAWRAHLVNAAPGEGIPCAKDMLLGFGEALDSARFKDGEQLLGLREILEPHDLRLAFGVIQTDAIITGPDVEIHALVADEFVRREESHRIETRFFCVHASLVDAARRSVQRLQHHTAPPYFFVAVADSLDCVHRLAIMPVHIEGKYMVFVESGQERTTAAQKIDAKDCFHKPTSRRELNELSKLHPEFAWLGCVNPWPYRPDWIGLSPSARKIEEQRGFKPKVMPAYDRHLTTKRRVFSALPFSEHSTYNEIDGTDLMEPSPAVDWEVAGFLWWRIPPTIPYLE